jgi:hypothetical protein
MGVLTLMLDHRRDVLCPCREHRYEVPVPDITENGNDQAFQLLPGCAIVVRQFVPQYPRKKLPERNVGGRPDRAIAQLSLPQSTP